MSDQDKFIQMVLSSGPQFQKLLQVIGRESGLSEDLRIVFQKLESSTLPVSDLVVKNIFESERANYDWVSYELKPLGVGTMAQVHRAKVRMNGKIKSVVVRFLKPGIEKRVYEDKRILSEIAPILDSNHVYLASGLPKLTPLVEDLSKTIIAELDLKATVDRQNMGYRVYRGSKTVDLGGYKNILKIQVPQVYWPTTPTKLMVQDMVFGKKLEKVSQQYESVLPKMKKAVAELVAEVWIEEVLFKSGFFHSDLHQGNFMVEFREDETKVNLIDFGMGGQISSTTQGAALALGVAVELLKPETITESLWDLSEQAHNLLLKTQFRALVDAKVLNIKHGLESGVKVEDWVAWAIQKGIKFPFIFISLNRGFGIINNMLKEAGSSHTLATISKKVGLKYALNIAKDLVDNESVTAKELVKLGLGIKKVPARCENIFMK
jgi:predicted unusual protein kinase regulating ubiquinone biosynthesis (AarF/ABC1/UbiB family)